MSLSVGEHGLTCLDGEDYSAIALSMQANANAIEAALDGIETNLDSYLSRWYWSAVNTSAVTVTSGSGTVLPDGSAGVTFLNDVGTMTVVANGFDATRFPAANFVFPTGLYLMGSSIKWTVATPNNNTPRDLMLWRQESVNGVNSTATAADIYDSIEYEQSAPGNDGSLSVEGFGLVANTPGTYTRMINAGFWHLNTSSTLVIPIGGWRLWYMRMGSGLVI